MKRKLLTSLAAATLSLAMAGCATDSGYYGDRGGYSGDRDSRDYRDNRRYASRCQNCGIVERIRRDGGRGDSSGTGAVVGAVVGGVAGNQIGSGDGRTAATVAGAVAGGIAGNEIEKRNNRGEFELYVRTDDGRAIIARQRDLNGIREGDRVEVRGNRAYLLR